MKKSCIIWCLLLMATLSLPTEKLEAETSGTGLPFALSNSLSDCDSPNALHVSSVAGSSAMVIWSPPTANLPDSYIVRYKADAQPVWTEVVAVDTFLMLTGLERATRYCVNLFYVCGFDTTLSASVCFSTLHYLECLETDANPINITGSPQLNVGGFPISGTLHSYMEQIVRAHELSPDGSPVLLTGISYQYTSPYSLNTKNHVEIYLAHREDSVYSNSHDFTPLTEASLVYVGDFYCQLGWNYFEFSTPFYFDGVHNLVVFVLDKTVDTANSGKVYHNFKCHRIPNNYVSLGWVTTSTLDPNAPFLPTADFIRNNMRFTVCSHIDSNSCTPPNIYHYEYSNDSITVSWVSGLEDTAWVLRYRMVTDDSWTYDSAATSPYKIYAQSPDNLYGIEIQSKCNDSLYSVWKSPFSTEETPCPPVNGITLSSVTEHTAEITWTAGGNENYWFYYPTADFTTPAPPPANEGWIFTDNPLLLDSLADGHCYRLWIRAGCGAGNVSSAQPFEFWTECQEITLPYTEDFDHPDSVLYLGFQNSGPLPHCWRKLSPYLDSGPYCTSDSCLTFYSTSNEYKVAILPRLSDDLLISHLKMSFYCKKLQNSYSSSLIVGVMDNPTDLSSFTPVDTVYTPDVNWWNWHQREVFFENYTGTGHYIALKYQNSSSNYFKMDNLTIDTAFTCHTPTNLMATGISPSSIYVTWEDEDSENEWQVALVPNYLTDPIGNSIVTVHEKHYLFTNLTDSNYVFFVRTRCANGWGYSEWVSVPVSTFSHDPAEVPYFHDFENGSENAAWRVENGNFVNRWYIGIPNGYNDSLLFITNNYGVDASYSSTQSVAWAYRDFFFSGATEYEVKFRWLCQGNTNYGYMQALVGEPAPIPVSQSYYNILYPDGAELLGKYVLQNNWKTDRYVFGSEYDNTLQRLYFLWRNASYSANPPGALIDYVQIIPYHCVRPTGLTLDFVYDHEAVISFSPALNEVTNWEYVVLQGDSFPDDSLLVLTTSNTSVTLSELSENTSYTLYIRGVCSNGYHSSWAEFKFRTECSPLVLPYVETFDVTEGSKFECWSFPAPETGIQRPSIYKPTHDWEVDTNPLLRFSGIGPYHALAILPEVPSDYSLNSLRLSFLIRTNTDSIHLIVGVMSDPDDFSTFIPVDTVQTVEPFYIDRKEVFFDYYQGSGTYIAILSDYVGDNTCYLYVDDLVLDIAPTCLAPSGLKAINMDQNSVMLVWNPANDEQSWEIAYGTDDFDPDSTENICVANTNPFTLTGLDEGTFYGFYVRALCSSGEYSEWSPLGYAFTRCAPVSVVGQPYQESFDGYTTGISSSAYSPIEYPYISYPDCWSFLNLHALVGYPDGTLPAAFLYNGSMVVWGNSLQLVNSKVTPLYAVLPEFVEHLRFLKLTFSYKYSPWRPYLSVGYMTNPSDGSTYHEVQFCPSSNSNNFTTLTINYSTLGLDPDSNYYIAFRAYDSVSGWLNVALENVKVELIPNAFPAPTQLNVSDITTHSAVLDWTNGNDEDHWVVQYRVANRSGWADSMEVLEHPVLLDSLATNTEYEVRVKSVYGKNNNTMCSAYTTTAFTTLDDTWVPEYGGFDQHVTIRPNPAKQYIDVILEEESGPCQIELYDSQSRKVREMSMAGKSVRIPLGHLASGVYFIQIKGDDIKVTKKFIKE